MKILLSTLLALALAPGCAVPSLDVMPRYGSLDIDGSFGITNSGTLTLADLSQAGFEKDNGVLGLRADLDFGAPRLVISLQDSSHDGAGTLSADLTNGAGETISAGSSVDSALDIGLYQGVLTWDLFPGDTGELGIGLGIVAIDIDASITESGGSTLDIDEFAPIPVISLRGGVKLGDLEVSGLLNAMEASVGFNELSFIDLDLFARYAIVGGEDRLRVSAGLGYRHAELDIESSEDGEDIAVNFAFTGPYLLFQLSF
ncbi:MAG: hypothetical protein ABGY71_10430 [bacterium]|nr:hypothetical protein [Planctomycetota bacterium]HIL50746.1 hypothetical protein [Planctomycetota bacterium]